MSLLIHTECILCLNTFYKVLVYCYTHWLPHDGIYSGKIVVLAKLVKVVASLGQSKSKTPWSNQVSLINRGKVWTHPWRKNPIVTSSLTIFWILNLYDFYWPVGLPVIHTFGCNFMGFVSQPQISWNILVLHNNIIFFLQL